MFYLWFWEQLRQGTFQELNFLTKTIDRHGDDVTTQQMLSNWLSSTKEN